MSRVSGRSSPAVSSSRVGRRRSRGALTRSAAVTAATALAPKITAGDGVNVEEDSEATPAEMGAAPSPSSSEEKVEGTETATTVPRRAAKQGRFGITIRRRIAATTALAKAKKVTSAKSRTRPDPAGVIMTSSGRIVKRNAKYFPRVYLPARVTGNGGGSKRAGAALAAPKKRGRGRPPKKASVPSKPPNNGLAGPASKPRYRVPLFTGFSSLTARASSSAGTAPPKPFQLSYSYSQQMLQAGKQLQSSWHNFPGTQVLPSTSAGVGGTTMASTLLSTIQRLTTMQQSSMASATSSAVATRGQAKPTPGPPLLLPPPPVPMSRQSVPQIMNTFSLNQPTPTPSTSQMAYSRRPGNVPIPPVGLEPPQPPNFQQHLDETLMSLSTHKRFPIDKDSEEFKGLKQLLSPLNVTSAEQIANPDLWQRFNTTRKEMLRTKSSDLNLISKLFPLDKDVLKAAQLSLKFNKDPQLMTEQGKYSPNEALLFHCVRDPNNMESILSQGLDERLGNYGLFGRGIYFTDSPTKAALYDRGETILIFAVLLGDCLPVSYGPHNSTSFVREPEKKREQMRSHNDKFVDSITSSVTGGHNDNEYIIYNRYQCCPLYIVKYKGRSGPTRGMSPYCGGRWEAPSIAWVTGSGSGSSMAMPNQSRDGSWPFFAESIFRRMGVRVETPRPMDPAPVSGASGSSDDEQNQKIKCLVSMGFPNEVLNRTTLKIYKNDLNKAVEFLMKHAKSNPQPSTSKAGVSDGNPDAKLKHAQKYADLWNQISMRMAGLPRPAPSPKKNKKGNPADASKTGHPTTTTTTVVTIDSSDDEDGQPSTKKGKVADRETCDICYMDYASFARSPELWKELKCSHRLCLKCHNRIETTRTTMAGVSHTFVKCPFCQGTSGTEVGTCPDGQMQMDIINVECSGYQGTQTIEITYDISTGQNSLHRVAYLPYTPEGYAIMELLETAWDRRICFMIGTSLTTGQQNVPVWNIHHKTNTQGGPQLYGYPDPGYFQRVRDELKAYGIE